MSICPSVLCYVMFPQEIIVLQIEVRKRFKFFVKVGKNLNICFVRHEMSDRGMWRFYLYSSKGISITSAKNF